MVVEADVDLADYRAFLKFAVRNRGRDPDKKDSAISWKFLPGAVVGFLLVTLIGQHEKIGIHWPSVAVTSVFFIAFIALYFYHLNQAQSKLLPRPGGMILGRHTMTFSSNGLALKSPYYETKLKWSGVQSIHDDGNHLFLMIDTGAGYVIPKRCLPYASAADELLDLAAASKDPNKT